MSPVRPIEVVLARVQAEIVADGVVDADEVAVLEQLARDSSRGTAAASSAIRPLATNTETRFSSETARQRVQKLIDAPSSLFPRPDNEFVRYAAPPTSHTLRAHDLYLKRSGVLDQDTGRRPYSRGWGQFNAGVLQKAHGSSVPPSRIHPATQRAELTALSPAQRLDEATRAFGIALPWSSFVALGDGFSRPDQPDWAGVCFSWSWAALDARLSALVDVAGPEGQRGVWIGGQFLSRADLGNWLMALASGLSQGAGDVLWYAPEAPDLLKAALGYLVDGSPGFRADIGNSHERSSEVWFQPFVGCRTEISDISRAAQEGVLAAARAPRKTAWGTVNPGVEGATVKLVAMQGRFGDERDDDWEGEPQLGSLDWNVYAVLDAAGKVVDALMADDDRIATVTDLPVRVSAPVPRELFVPDHSLVDGILEGEPSAEVCGSVYGPALDFFIGHVLARGVPASVRQAFEAEPALVRSGPIPEAERADLMRRYPTIANAYAPGEWAHHFAPVGLEAAAFGAPELAS